MRIKNVWLLTLILLLGTSAVFAKTRKTVYVIMDGVTPDNLERLRPKTIFDIAKTGTYSRAYTGGEIGGYSETATISAIGYTNILTGTWVNKHNVTGNYNLSPNYNYWTIFRIAKEQTRDVKTALFSTWTDNRTVLIGAGKSETDHLKIDYVFDGYESDTIRFPKKDKHLHLFDIDSVVCVEAAKSIRTDAPDLSWVYLEYTDSGYHLKGDGTYSDGYVLKTDELIGKVWDAVQYREKNFDEEWLMIVLTDHGRNESGHSHGGQSARERSVWISTNQHAVNSQFCEDRLSLVDVNPAICEFMGFDVPEDVLFEQDGISFFGKTDIYDLQTKPYDDFVFLEWKSENSKEKVDIYMAITNAYKEGGKDNWVKIANVPASQNRYKVDLQMYDKSKFYKFVVVSPNNHISRWLRK